MKKYIKIKLLFALLAIFCAITQVKLFAQPNLAVDIAKYWHYRDRLKYFWIPEFEPAFQGDGLIAGIRNQVGNNLPQDLNYNEEAVYMGYFMGVLATEYYLLNSNHQNTDETLNDLYIVLNAYEDDMDACEQDCYRLSYGNVDGFFVRSRIDDNFLSFPYYSQTNKDALNDGLNKDETFSSGSFSGLEPGQPGYITSVSPKRHTGGCEVMSQDESIGLLMGLALVAEEIPSGTIVQGFDIHGMATDIATRIVKYIGSGSYYNLGGEPYGYCGLQYFDGLAFEGWWHIYDPNCNYIGDDSGGDALAYSWGFYMAAQNISLRTSYDFYYNLEAAQVYGKM